MIPKSQKHRFFYGASTHQPRYGVRIYNLQCPEGARFTGTSINFH
jgi:hypothetical protein